MSDYNAKRAERGWPLSAEHGTRTAEDSGGFSREVVFEPGHPLTLGTGPSSNYGRGALKIRFLLHGPKGSVQFFWSTGITPERAVERDVFSRASGPFAAGHVYEHQEWMHSAPTGFDLGYHSDAPQYDEHDTYECEYRPGGKCYYDGSSLAADRILELFLTQGEDAMWEALRERYNSQFEADR